MNNPGQMNKVETRSVENASVNKSTPCTIRSSLIRFFQRNIDEVSDDVAKWLESGDMESNRQIEEVMESIGLARAKLDELSEAGAEPWTITLKSLSVEWRRLRTARANARAEIGRQVAEEFEALIHRKTNTRPMFLR